MKQFIISEEEKIRVKNLYGINESKDKKFPYEVGDILEIQIDKDKTKKTITIKKFENTEKSVAIISDENGIVESVSFFRDYKNKGMFRKGDETIKHYDFSTVFTVMNVKRGDTSFKVN